MSVISVVVVFFLTRWVVCMPGCALVSTQFDSFDGLLV